MHLHLLALAGLLFLAAPALADTPNPYAGMTLEELEAADCKELDKPERKLCTKALKAAKKVEKARIKAEKKAERARLKAEKKRLREAEKQRKAEVRRQTKIRKEAARTLEYIDRVRRKSEFHEDEFAASVTVQGMESGYSNSSFFAIFGDLDSTVGYFLRSFYYPDSGKLVTQVYVSMQTDKIVEEEQLARAEAAPIRYANRHRLWKNYSRAALRGGKSAKLFAIDSWGEINYGIGKFYEEVAVTIDMKDIEDAVRGRRSLDFKLYSSTAPDIVIKVSYHYMLGYGLRLMDLGSDFAMDRALFLAPYRELQAKSRHPQKKSPGRR